MCGVGAQFEKCSRIDQQVDTFARGQASLVVLALDRLGPATLANLFLLVAHLRDQVGQESHVGFKARGRWVHTRREHG